MDKTEVRLCLYSAIYYTKRGEIVSKKYDLIGKTFGRLTVRKKVEKPNCKKKAVYWECVCECGNIVIRSTEKLMRALKNNTDSSCGCNRKAIAIKSSGKMIDGQRFGRLVVLETIWESDKYNKPMVRCKCDCGNEIIVAKNDVQSLHTQSCGCLQRERTSLDGKQHYEPIEYFGGIDEYQDRVHKDNIKNEYCKNNFIPLYRFTYAESKDDIEKKIINIVNRNDCGTFMVT